MNKRAVVILLILLIILLSAFACLFAHYLVGWSWKKSLIIAAGAGVAMIVFDVLLTKRKFVE